MSVENTLVSKRFYKVKNPRTHFLCALCSAPRQMKYSKNLSAKNYLQVMIISTFFSWALFPIMGIKATLLIFPLWMMIEISNKILYRKEIPCPYCGFDATWYRRDVKVANQKVKDFWKTNHPDLLEKDKAEEVDRQQEQMNPAATQDGPEANQQETVI